MDPLEAANICAQANESDLGFLGWLIPAIVAGYLVVTGAVIHAAKASGRYPDDGTSESIGLIWPFVLPLWSGAWLMRRLTAPRVKVPAARVVGGR